VAHAEAFELVKESCLSIWLRATPEEYLGRVYAQGDTRPMESCTDAMAELRRLVEERAPLYQQATISLDTSGKSVEEMVASLSQSLEGRMMTICPFICSPL
jgi:XRE family aerobic/anaerobic benzoate catabolism transcriptional regulator